MSREQQLIDLKKELAQGAFRPKGFEGMEFAFLDHEGREYYSWPKAENMPAIRIKVWEHALAIIDAGMGKESTAKFSELLQATAHEIVQAKSLKAAQDKAVKVAVIAKELTFRRTQIIPEDAWYLMAAVCCARQDEEAYGFDPVIHEQKMATFKSAARSGDPFFTASPAFQAALGPSLTTVEGSLALLRSWIQIQQREQVVMEALV